MLPLLIVLACSSKPEPAATPAPPPVEPPAAPAEPARKAPAPDDATALNTAGAAAEQFSRELKGRLKAALEAGGPPEGIDVCTEAAPNIAKNVAAEHGVAIGRASLKLRNPDNQGPEWVQKWLAAQGADAKAEGIKPLRTLTDTPDGRVGRLIVPIAVDPVCLACHGPADGLAEPVQARLAEHYPADQATGYAAGDLRGALWVEVPVGADKVAPAGTDEAPASGGSAG